MRHLLITKQFTNKDDLLLDLYFKEISKVSLLTIDDEVILSQKIKSGDPKAFEILIISNLRFVISIAKQYLNKGLTLSDLINEGNLGLIKAAERFDGARGFKFISYAVWWIRKSILKAISENARLVRIPANKIGAISKVSKAIAKLEQKYQREPMPTEIAELLKFKIKVVEEILQSANLHISIDAPLYDDSDDSFFDILISNDAVSPDKALDDSSLNTEIDRIFGTLADKDSRILYYYFGLTGEKALSIDEIAIKMGYTHETTRQLKDGAIRKLKDNYKNSLLRPFLG